MPARGDLQRGLRRSSIACRLSELWSNLKSGARQACPPSTIGRYTFAGRVASREFYYIGGTLRWGNAATVCFFAMRARADRGFRFLPGDMPNPHSRLRSKPKSSKVRLEQRCVSKR